MEEKEESKIVLIPIGSVSPTTIETSIAAFNEPLANLLTHIGLPTENILSPISERRKVIFSLESTLEILPIDARTKATYLSKFTVAITVGLFDGALNFLWDETIRALRSLIVSFDLQYFSSVAETISTRYKRLSDENDLQAISEHDLLDICRRIGLINDINHKRLEHVNYLRNHASSAHPNDNEVTGIEMLSLLEHCLKYAITAQPDHSVIQLKLLLENIRRNTIPASDFIHIGSDLAKQPQERIDDFLKSIYGIYVDPRQDIQVKKNIENLAPHVWPCSTEDPKYVIGAKYGYYRKNADVDKKDATQTFLEIVDGLHYKDEDSLAAELIEKLQNLRNVHFDWNNFYNEYPHAKSIDSSLPGNGQIPEAAKRYFVKVICICYVGNGKGYRSGVDENALIYYKKYIETFTITEVKLFLNLFTDNEFLTDLDKRLPESRMRTLATHLKTKTTDVHVNRALDVIINYPSNSLHKLGGSTPFKDSMKFVNQ